MATSFFNGESTFPENNTTDQLIDALKAQLAESATESTAAQAAAVAAQASASNAAISEGNVAGLSQAATDTLSQATTALAAANAAIASTAASATTATNQAAAASNSALGAATSATNAGISETNSATSAAAALASKNAAGTSETNSAASAAAALSSKNAAGTSETNAAASATAANTSKNNAATSETNAASSATAASGSATAASGSATAAGTSATNAATSATQAAASATLTTNQTAYLAGRNRIINGNFAINQRGYVSGAATGTTNQYTLDRWRVVVSGQVATFAASGNGNLVTAPAGGLEQVIEGINIEGGTFTLSWTGTATATVNGSAVANKGQVTLPANTNATVRFSGGTVGLVQLEAGSVATPFERRSYGQELALCQRYYEIGSLFIQVPAASIMGVYISLKVSKRATPTLAFSNTAYSNANSLTQTGGNSGAGFGVNLTATASTGYATSDWSATSEL